MLSIERLSAHYGERAALTDVSAAFDAGLNGIVGPNGSGKSTLLKCAAGLVKPSAGDIELEGEAVTRLAPRQLAKKIAYMPQSRDVPDLTVLELTRHGRYPYLAPGRALGAADHAAVGRALERAGASALADRRVQHLSGGERQKAYLAMLLAQDAQVCLLDEPLGALDPKAQFETMALLKELAREGRVIIVVMHDLGMALSMCDMVLVMDSQRAVKQAAPGALYESGVLGAAFGVDVLLIDGRYFIEARRGSTG